MMIRNFPANRRFLSVLASALLLSIAAAAQQAPAPARAKLYNAAKQKLLDGKQIYSYTMNRFDPELYCQAAPHYDYVWLDMQHSTLSWADIEKMIGACPGVGTPMIRVADELESTLQKATDVGALGVIEPTVDTVEKAMAVVRYTKYPPEGRRSRGQAQAANIYGKDYRQTANDNMLVVVMIETPVGVANAYDIARVPGVDVVMAANNDLGNFSGFEDPDPRYTELFQKIHDATLKAGKLLGAADARFTRKLPNAADYRMFQNPADSIDGWTPPARRP